VRRISIEDVGVATAFLAREAARLITGKTLYMMGAITSWTSPRDRWARKA
jgi:enoyl-[acyl-carrier-protein] reductase (NADH)